jgi:hypothetical protein
MIPQLNHESSSSSLRQPPTGPTVPGGSKQEYVHAHLIASAIHRHEVPFSLFAPWSLSAAHPTFDLPGGPSLDRVIIVAIANHMPGGLCGVSTTGNRSTKQGLTFQNVGAVARCKRKGPTYPLLRAIGVYKARYTRAGPIHGRYVAPEARAWASGNSN